MENVVSKNVFSKLFVILFLIAATTGAVFLSDSGYSREAGIYEIRSYHIEPAELENYKIWISTHGLPYIRKHLDVVGFWVEGDVEAQVSGAAMDEMGSANVIWIIKWASMEEREAGMDETFGTAEWQKIFARLPGGMEAYLRTEVRFFDGI